MIIQKKIFEFQTLADEPLSSAMEKLNRNKSKVIFVTDQTGALVGALSDGDVRRKLIDFKQIDLNDKILNYMNKDPVFCYVDDSSTKIESKFSNRITVIPIVNSIGKLVAIAKPNTPELVLDDFTVNESSECFIIAEIGNNHQGDFEIAKLLVDAAITSGANCAKFQLRTMEKLYNKNFMSNHAFDLGAEYTLDILGKFQLKSDELFLIFDYCYQKGILPLCTPWDLHSLNKLEEYGLSGYKIASADLTNPELLLAAANTRKPLICSTGMSVETEILSAKSILDRHHAPFAFLHCNSTYPTPFKDVNLNYLTRLKEITNGIIGYSGHERGYSVPLVAVGLGAKIIEKHLTLDKSQEGNDHKVSLLPQEFKAMVSEIRNIEAALGFSDERVITQGEMINRENLAKSIHSGANIKKGQSFREEDLVIRSPGQGLPPYRLIDVIGKTAKRDLRKGDVIYEDDISGAESSKGHFKFKSKFGIPVRFHDFRELKSNTNLDFVEFHLSYQDLRLDVSKYLDDNYDCGFVVHAPELFENDHILDLASEDVDYRSTSIDHIEKTIQTTLSLRQYFPSTKYPIVILNAGGWSHTGFSTRAQRLEMYERVKESLNRLDLSEIRLCIQTMPPFPWHFGGQNFHNLFVDPLEIEHFCNRTGIKICLDISHSMMACNYYNWDFDEFLNIVLPHTSHLHVVDASGVDGEGIQMGKGDVDFDLLLKYLKKEKFSIPIVPEIWQGHKNKGEGFWKALRFLELKGY